jgi:hypothetical protein
MRIENYFIRLVTAEDSPFIEYEHRFNEPGLDVAATISLSNLEAWPRDQPVNPGFFAKGWIPEYSLYLSPEQGGGDGPRVSNQTEDNMFPNAIGIKNPSRIWFYLEGGHCTAQALITVYIF